MPTCKRKIVIAITTTTLYAVAVREIAIYSPTNIPPPFAIYSNPFSKQGLIDILAYILGGEPRIVAISVPTSETFHNGARISSVRLDDMQITVLAEVTQVYTGAFRLHFLRSGISRDQELWRLECFASDSGVWLMLVASSCRI